MVSSTRFIALLSALAAAVAVPAKRDVATVEADIASISTQVNTLDAAIDAYPTTGGTLLAALVCLL